jgi:hypothetical protein
MAKKKSHCTVRNNALFCLNCGGTQTLTFPMAVDMFAAMAKAFEKMHKNCDPTWKQLESNPEWSMDDRARFWFEHGERGASSESIFHWMTSRIKVHNHPLDPDDFKRCYGLLRMVPEFRQRIMEMAFVSDEWKRLAENWEKLTEMFIKARETNDGKEMYEYMQKLITKP